MPWDDELLNSHSTGFMDFTGGPERQRLPRRDPAVRAGHPGRGRNNTAGTHSPFSVTVTRNDGDQNLTGLNVNTPPGFAATLKGVPYCPESAIDLLRSAGLLRQSRAGVARLPGREPDRHRHHRRRRRQPPALHARARSTSRARTRALR